MTNTAFKLRVNLRSRLNYAIKNKQKKGSAVRDLGCSIEELKSYLENKFYPHSLTGELMTWNNWGHGKGKWSIDHVIELHRVNIEDEVEFKRVVHFTNLQPLWYEDHLRKSIENHGQ
jgi:hypothetical protein